MKCVSSSMSFSSSHSSFPLFRPLPLPLCPLSSSVPPPPDVSSELGVRLRAQLEHTERLDAQFVEYLRCRGMNPAANTDSAAGSWSYSDELLPPELQVGRRTHCMTRPKYKANTNAD